MSHTASTWVQGTLGDHGEPLHQTTFVVLDLETTGGSPNKDRITEIGAVKVRGGDVIGEFHTLVNPHQAIPPFIVALTGITEGMVAQAPSIESVLPSLLEFLGAAVLVAHNARFDAGFLKAACRRHDFPWPGNEVVDTVLMARRATTKEEAPNKKLSTLAPLFGARVSPSHRALDDARATVDVFHGLLERLAHLGVTHRQDLATLRGSTPHGVRRKAHLAERLPERPGVYTFIGPDREPLYVGKAKHLRTRVKSYFTNGEQRSRIREMVTIATAVTVREYATEVEAAVRELHAIDSLRPRYNQASTRPERAIWVTLSQEAHPRLVVRRDFEAPDLDALGPIPSTQAARQIIEVYQDLWSTRTCTTRLPARPTARGRACLLKDLGRCAAPCVSADSGYVDALDRTRRTLRDPTPVIEHLRARIDEAAIDMRYETAATLRDTLEALIWAGIRRARSQCLSHAVLVAAVPRGRHWEMLAVAHGALVGSRVISERPWHAAIDLRERALSAAARPVGSQETDLLWDWLTTAGVRLLYVDGVWASPLPSMAAHQDWLMRSRGAKQAWREARAAAEMP